MTGRPGSYKISFTVLGSETTPDESGTNFGDWVPPNKRLAKVYIRHSADGIHGLCSEWVWKQGQYLQRGQFYGNQDAGQQTELLLEEGELLEKVMVWQGASCIVKGLAFQTNKKRFPSSGCLGSAEGTTERVLAVQPNKQIVGFKGKRGADIDAIDVVQR